MVVDGSLVLTVFLFELRGLECFQCRLIVGMRFLGECCGVDVTLILNCSLFFLGMARFGMFSIMRLCGNVVFDAT